MKGKIVISQLYEQKRKQHEMELLAQEKSIGRFFQLRDGKMGGGMTIFHFSSA